MKEFNIMKKAIKFAGKKIFLKGSKNINFKADFDYFTDNDLQCEKYFISVIKKHFPNDNILSEETRKDEKLEDRTWVIDPIDGTHNYANGFKECGIQLAFFNEGETKFSMIYLPYYDELYTCVKGEGVLLNGKKIVTEKDIELRQALITFSSIPHKSNIKDMSLFSMSEINEKVLNIRIAGSGCWEFACILRKRFGGFIVINSKINKWDLMPGMLMCQENDLPFVNKKLKGVEYFIVANNDKILKFTEKKVKESILKFSVNKQK